MRKMLKKRKKWRPGVEINCCDPGTRCIVFGERSTMPPPLARLMLDVAMSKALERNLMAK